MINTDIRWACSAQLDLLGFSNHLMVANCDIRTQTGAQAIERLSSLEKAIRFFEQEKTKYPDLYPSRLEYIRFNDAIFLGIDVKYLNPPTGRTSLTGGYSINQLRKRYPREVRQGDVSSDISNSISYNEPGWFYTKKLNIKKQHRISAYYAEGN